MFTSENAVNETEVEIEETETETETETEELENEVSENEDDTKNIVDYEDYIIGVAGLTKLVTTGKKNQPGYKETHCKQLNKKKIDLPQLQLAIESKYSKVIAKGKHTVESLLVFLAATQFNTLQRNAAAVDMKKNITAVKRVAKSSKSMTEDEASKVEAFLKQLRESKTEVA